LASESLVLSAGLKRRRPPALHLFTVLVNICAQRVKQDHFGTGVLDCTQATHHILGSAEDGDALDAGHSAVESPQPIENLSTRPLGIVVHSKVNPLADRESGCIATLLVQLATDDPDLPDESFGSGGSGAKESVTVPDGPGERFGRVPSEPDRRMRALHRFGLDRHIVELPEGRGR
jgi:hypothetical protein